MLSIEFRKLLEALSQAGAEFIVVGGCAAVLQDVPISTFDLDIVHKRTPEIIKLLLTARYVHAMRSKILNLLPRRLDRDAKQARTATVP